MTNESISILHLSDIHFCKPYLGEAYDLDRDLRRMIEADAKVMQSNLGTPHAILVSGDVAFSGKVEQYNDAREWLDQGLCTSVKADPACIWTVPGNHDVDQSIIKPKPSYCDARKQLRDCDASEIEELLHRRLVEPHLFYDSLAAYNDFAVELGCDVNVSSPIVDTGEEFHLNDGSILRIYGLNSALVSDHNDHEERGRMVLGKHQCLLDRDPRFVNIVMCHHPPDWLRDGDDIEETLNPRCSVQLFGHKHKHCLTKVNDSLLKVAAGAVHPSRKEKPWIPRYNWLELRVEQQDDQRKLRVNVFPRVLHSAQRFDADRNATDIGSEYASFLLNLPPYQAPERAEVFAECLVVPQTIPGTETSKKMTDSRGNVVVDPLRSLVRRYFQLGYVQQMQIATELELLDNEDNYLPDNERLKRHLSRAKDEGQLQQLWDRVEEAHGDGRYPINPFDQTEGTN